MFQPEGSNLPGDWQQTERGDDAHDCDRRRGERVQEGEAGDVGASPAS